MRILGICTHSRIGKLKPKKRQTVTSTLPEEEYLIATVLLKNATNGKLIVVHNAWENVTLTDNFNNRYGQPNEVPYFLEFVEGVISHQELRSGEETADLLILQKPLDNARTFVLTADPGFYTKGQGGLLHSLSQDSFQIEFSRNNIQ